jgi:hypothetical protein
MQYFELTKQYTPIQITLFYRVTRKSVTYLFETSDFIDKNRLFIKKSTINKIIDQVNIAFDKDFSHSDMDVTIIQLLAYLVPLDETSLIQGKIGYLLILDQSPNKTSSNKVVNSQFFLLDIPSHDMENKIIFF